jgi:AcrR family transcriptional regulator
MSHEQTMNEGVIATESAGAARARPALSRVRILDCALARIDREGLEALSMRRLAAELDVSAMSLYNHVPNKEALLTGVTERLLSEIDLGVTETPDWTQALKAGFRSFRRALLAHPHALPLIEMKPAATPDSLRPVEVSLAILRRAGFDAEDAIKAHWVLVGYTVGHVNFQCVNPLITGEERKGVLSGQEDVLPPEEFPNFLESMPYAATCDFEDAYDWGLDSILDGLRGRLEGPPKMR